MNDMNAAKNLSALPATVIDADTAKTLPVHEDPTVGDTVVVYSRGRNRLARVAKVGPKRITVEYTTAGAWDTAADIAAQSRVARLTREIARDAKNADRYRRMADMIEALNITPTEDAVQGEYGRHSEFVPLASLPAEYAAVDAETGTNGARTTIVWKPESLRDWADSSEEHAAKCEAGMDEARAYDATPLAERVAAHVHVTTKNVARADVKVAP